MNFLFCRTVSEVFNSHAKGQGSPKFLSEVHITYYTTLQGPDILRNEIVSGYVAFYQINKCFVVYIIFIYIIFALLTISLRGPDEMLCGTDLARAL